EAGYKIAWTSYLSFIIGRREWLNPYLITMPGRLFLQRFIREAVKAGCQYLLVEVTSEGIKQHRHRFIDFDIAVFTNLAPEHLEAHGGFENYKKTKGKLFRGLASSFRKKLGRHPFKKMLIVNLDDKNSRYFLNFEADRKIGFSVKKARSLADQELHAAAYEIREDGIDFVLNGVKFHLPLVGRFNLFNAMAAIAVGISQGVDLKIARSALAKVKIIPGRMEEIDEGQNLRIFVDLAHTPDSFRYAFEAVSALRIPETKIISVFGAAGGGRDRWKRPVLGKIAARYSDFIVLANEDPYDENPAQIIFEIENGVKKEQFPDSHLFEIPDRREGIRKGLELADEGDIVLILGKGTEATYIVGRKKYPWDDRRVVREELKRLKESNFVKTSIGK
ncbi:MAG: UDP-N-acetylmuramyl-tripeptide synthetase, partial [bacterium]|nr:UDP-N-acetylmuramyl-tripeptide synthetase [bacterium]